MTTISQRQCPLVTDVETSNVREFMLKFGQLVFEQPGHLTKRKLHERFEFMSEELKEFADAAAVQDLAGMADALIDLCYVLKGTAIMLGLPWEELWADVHRANMAKVRGMTHRGHLVDACKPPGWVPPQTMVILQAHGYNEAEWHGPGEHVDEEKCRDDAVHQLP